jgi:hypothetical protein
MVNMPADCGSPANTAACAPRGSEGGAGPHFRPPGLTCDCAAEPSIKVAAAMSSCFFIGDPSPVDR